MPLYLVLTSMWLRANCQAGHNRHVAGATICFSGKPCAALYPLCDKARAARRQAILSLTPKLRERDDLQIHAYRAALGPTDQARLDAAISEFERWWEDREFEISAELAMSEGN